GGDRRRDRGEARRRVAHRLPRGRRGHVLRDLGHLHRPGLLRAGPDQHRRPGRGRGRVRRLPAALPGVRRRGGPGPDLRRLPGWLRRLRAGEAGRLRHRDRGQGGQRRPVRRGHRLPVGPAHRRPGAERLRRGPGRPGVLIGVKSRNAAAWAWFAGAAAFLVAAALLGVAAGYASITPGQIAGTLVAKAVPGMEPPLNDRQLAVLVELRLPRVVLGAMVGALLSVAGAAYQGVFRNPLADPYL